MVTTVVTKKKVKFAIGNLFMFSVCDRNYAVKSGNLEVTQRLLEMHTNPRIQEATEGKTALHQAIQFLHARIVHALLSYPSLPVGG